MKINLVRERRLPRGTEMYVDTFEVEDGVKDPEQALRDAVKQFLKTEEGKKMIEYSAGDFNWGDAVMSVPNEVWKAHGLTMVETGIQDIVVNQDEVLCEEEEE